MKRKLLSFLLALSMILTFMPAMAFAEDEPASSKVINVRVEEYGENDICEIDPEEGYDVVIESNATTDEIQITPSQLVRDGNSFWFRYIAEGDFPSDWIGGKITIATGSGSWDHSFVVDQESSTIGYNGRFQITTDEIRTAFNKEEAKGIINDRKLTVSGSDGVAYKEIDIAINLNNADFFRNDNNLKDANNLVMFSRDGVLERCDYTGQGSANKNNAGREKWRLSKSESTAEALQKQIDAVEKAIEKANQSASNAKEAVKKPGDAAVAAAQKAVDDNLAAQAEIEKLNDLMNKLTDGVFFINDAENHSDDSGVKNTELEEQANNNAAKLDKIDSINAIDSPALNDSLKESNALLAQAKAENAEKKAAADKAAAEEAARKAAADKAAADADKNAAEKAAADAAVLAYTPAKTKVTGVKSSKKKATVSFNKVPKNVTGYQIAVTNKKTGEVKIVYAKKSSKKTIKKTVKGLKKNTKYSVKVRAYNTVGTMTYCAPWSKAKSFKTKK